MKFSSESIGKKSYVCPSVNSSYIGDCPVTSCPYNISIRVKGSGGCFSNIENPDMISAAYALGIHTGQAERRYEKAIASSLQLKKITDSLKSVSVEKYCPNCYIEGDKCTHKYGCKERFKAIRSIAKDPIFKNQYLDIEKSVIWSVFLKNREIFSQKLNEQATRALNLPKIGVSQ